MDRKQNTDKTKKKFNYFDHVYFSFIQLRRRKIKKKNKNKKKAETV